MPSSSPSLRLAALALGAALTLSACGSTPPPEELTSGVQPTGSPVVVEPLDAIDGATTYTADGVTLQVPEGYEAQRTVSGQITTTEFRADGAPRPALTLVVGAGGTSTDVDVDLSSRVTEAQLVSDGATDVVHAPATLTGWPYAVAVTAAKDYGDDGGAQDLLAITTRDDAGDGTGRILVTATAEAPTGTLDGSAGDQMLRTLQPKH